MQDKLTPLQVILAGATLSSFGGLAALLRSGANLTARNLLSATLYSFVFGAVYCLLWYNYFDGEKQNFYFLIGSAGLVGLGGMTLIDFAVQVLLHGKVSITVKPDDDGKQDPPDGGK